MAPPHFVVKGRELAKPEFCGLANSKEIRRQFLQYNSITHDVSNACTNYEISVLCMLWILDVNFNRNVAISGKG